jgi:hypothetical protein
MRFIELNPKATPRLVAQYKATITESVRQEWNFSAPASIREAQEYKVELSNVTVLELVS